MSTSIYWNKILLLFSFLLFAFTSLAQHPLSAEVPGGATLKPYTVVFKLKVDYTSSSRPAQLQNLHKQIEALQPKTYKQKFPKAPTYPLLKPGEIDLTLFYELEYRSAYSFESIKNMLLQTGIVEYVEPIYIPAPLYTPNDPLADSTNNAYYYLKKIKAYQGWDVQKGDTSIVIGILDTGVRLTHNDLKSKIKYNYADPIDGIDNDNDGYVDNFRGWDLADNDNNPTADGNSHGVLVSGVAAAATDNGIGVAGVGFNSKFLPLKVYASTLKGSFAGYEAIVYAADHGCQVISISWGSPGFHSEYEQAIINYAAINKQVTIVAAAGNTAGNIDFYPASYNNVLSVSSVDRNDSYVGSHTSSNYIDIAAGALGIWTTGSANDDNYTFGNGTSFATPIVAGSAALVRKQFPNYTGLQVAEQVRRTADNLYNLPANTTYLERRGYGRVNLLRALTETTTKSVRNTHNQFSKKYIYPGDTLKITSTFTNFLAPVSNLQVSLTSSSPHVTIVQGTYAAGALTTLATKTNSIPFRVFISTTIPQNEVISLRYGFTDGAGYTDYQYLKVQVNTDFVTIDVNDLDVTITSKGTIGYNGRNYEQGEGVVYKKQDPILQEGGLLIGSSATQVSDNLRNAIPNPIRSDDDFYTVQPVRMDPNLSFADMGARGVMQDSFPGPGTVGVRVTHRAYAWKDAPDNKYVIVEYKITNTTKATLTNLYAGLYSDWDIYAAARNVADWDATQKMGYTYHVGRKDQYAGTKLLTAGAPTHYAIDKAFGPFANISLADGFTTTEKYKALSNPTTANTQAGLNGTGNDVADVVGTKLPDLAAGASTLVAFAILAGDNLADLQASAAAAQNRYNRMLPSSKPIVQVDSICKGEIALIRPKGGSSFQFYADASQRTLLALDSVYRTPRLNASTTYYVSNIDFGIESPVVPVIVPVRTDYRAAFKLGPKGAVLTKSGELALTDESIKAVSWTWYVGDELRTMERNPTLLFTKAGKHRITLVIKTKEGCTESVTKEIEVLPPIPMVAGGTTCAGSRFTITPQEGTAFRFYADSQRQQLLGSGSSFQTLPLVNPTTFYVSNFDFGVESELVPVTINVTRIQVEFTYSPEKITPATQGKIKFTSQAPNAVKWDWQFGDGSRSTSQNPVVQFQQAGKFMVKLKVQTTDGCIDSVTKTIDIPALAYNLDWEAENFIIFPNPTTQSFIKVNIPLDIYTEEGLTFEIINMAGSVLAVYTTLQPGINQIPLSQQLNGMYLLRIRGRDGLITKKFQILRF